MSLLRNKRRSDFCRSSERDRVQFGAGRWPWIGRSHHCRGRSRHGLCVERLSFFGVIVVIARWKRHVRKSQLPPETLGGATLAAFRYVRYSPGIRTLLLRSACVIFFSSAFWALLPAVARELSKSSVGYGLLLGFFGMGAVIGAIVLQRARRQPPSRPWCPRRRWSSVGSYWRSQRCTACGYCAFS